MKKTTNPPKKQDKYRAVVTVTLGAPTKKSLQKAINDIKAWGDGKAVIVTSE